MALITASAHPTPANSYVFFDYSPTKTLTNLQLAEGDFIIYCTGETLLGTYYIEQIKHSPDLYWSIRSQENFLYDGKENYIDLPKHLQVRIPVPIRISRTPRGYKTHVTAKHPDNCSAHTLHYVQHYLPKVYQQVQYLTYV